MEITAAQIKQWKAKYGELYQITTPLDDTGKKTATGIFRKPDLKIIAAASSHFDAEPLKAGEIIFKNCWVGGDEEIYATNDEAKMSVMAQLGNLFKVRTSSLKKI